ncbi:MAG: hypothetical protein Q8O84_05015, partial [Nanoarchaeota archaeon]|nr:hypothetical protein [Nanoarchaeota archaeon]
LHLCILPKIQAHIDLSDCLREWKDYFKVNEKFWCNEVKPFTLCYAKFSQNFVGVFLGPISEVFLFFRRKKLSVAKQPRAISHYLGWEKKEKLKFGRSQATSRLRKVFFSSTNEVSES